METFLSIHRDVITGTLSTFDRIIFKGHLLDFFPARGLPNFLSRQGILLKGFGGYVQATSEELKTHIQRLAADAVRKQLTEIRAINPRDVLILSGDHLYRMDYALFLRAHRQAEADITLAVHPVSRADAPRFGIVETGSGQRIVNFHEKPGDHAQLDALATHPDSERPYLASMGIYLFRAETLYQLLETNSGPDFGQHILPCSLRGNQVMAYPFDGYWEDIGTIRAFYDTNLALTGDKPPFNLYDPERPIYTHPRFLPPSQVDRECILDHVLLADGCRIVHSQICESVVGIRSLIGPDTRLTRTIMMGADEYETDAERADNAARDMPDIGVGRGCIIEGAIIDKNARIGDDVVIQHIPNREDVESESYVSRDGIVVVLKNAIIPKGTVI